MLHECPSGIQRRSWYRIPKYDSVSVRHLETTAADRVAQGSDMNAKFDRKILQWPEPMWSFVVANARALSSHESGTGRRPESQVRYVSAGTPSILAN